MQTQQSQMAFAALYQTLSPFINALLGFCASLALYWIKDRDPSTKEFERQTKRLQFWKAFYDLEAIAPIKPTVEHHRRCKQTMDRAAFWVAAIPTRAHTTAKHIAVVLMCCSSSFFYTGIIEKFPPLPSPMSSWMTVQLVTAHLSVLIGVLWASYQLVYQGVRTGLTEALLDLAEKVSWFSFFKEMGE